MAPKASKPAVAAAPRSSSKRAGAEIPSRQSKRTKAAKQSYIEPESDEDVEGPGSPSSGGQTDAKESDYDAESGNDPTSESDHEGLSIEDDSKPAKGTPRGRSAKRTALPLHKKRQDDQELWKSGATLTPGTQVIIKKPKAREAGDTPYQDDTIHPNTMLFLNDLAAHNDRQWLKAHDPDYRASLQDFTTFLEKLSENVIAADDTIPELPVKDIIFRIYRDIRFSKDPTPYKTHFSAAWSRTGRKGPYAAYYVQIEPNGGSFVGGGLWQPEASALNALRRDIDRKPQKIKRALTDAGIRKAFFGGISNDGGKAVKAFINQTSNRSTALKKHPKGYDSDHKDIDLLRLRSFTLGTKLSDNEVVGAKGLERITEHIACMVPFIRYLNSVVMPDEQSADSSEDEEDGNSGDESAGTRDSDA